jgi:hypothetical protein
MKNHIYRDEQDERDNFKVFLRVKIPLIPFILVDVLALSGLIYLVRRHDDPLVDANEKAMSIRPWP